MRKIKFRGRDSFTGEFHYGFYFADEDGVQVFENRHSYLVDPESVAQFVGYDANGNEVYEGDELVGANGFEFKARFVGNLTDGDKLKEESKP